MRAKGRPSFWSTCAPAPSVVSRFSPAQSPNTSSISCPRPAAWQKVRYIAQRGLKNRESPQAPCSGHEQDPLHTHTLTSPTDARCVVYCTVGYRSGRYAEALRRQGKDAYNLAGGILAWTHHGGALEEPGGAGSTRAVHVFARKWDLAASAYESTYFM